MHVNFRYTWARPKAALVRFSTSRIPRLNNEIEIWSLQVTTSLSSRQAIPFLPTLPNVEIQSNSIQTVILSGALRDSDVQRQGEGALSPAAFPQHRLDRMFR